MIQHEAIREHLFNQNEKVDELQLLVYRELMVAGTLELKVRYRLILHECLKSKNQTAIARVIAGVAVSRHDEDGPAQKWFEVINDLLISRGKLDCEGTAFGLGLTLGLFRAGVALDSYEVHDENGFGRITPEIVASLILSRRPFFQVSESRFIEDNKHFLVKVSEAIKLWVNSYHMKGNLVYINRYRDIGRIVMLVSKEIKVGYSFDRIFKPSLIRSGIPNFGDWLMKELYYALASKMTSVGMVLALASMFRKMNLTTPSR